jgi:hypothetical protein
MICRPRSLGFHEHSECTARVVDLTTARYRSLPTGRVYFSGYVGGYLPRGSCRLRGDRARSDSFCTVTYVPRDANGRYALTATYPGNVEYHASGDHTDVAVDYTNTQTRLTCDAGNVDEFHTIRCLAQVFDADPNNPRRPPTGDIAWNGNLSTATFIPTNTCHLHAAFPASAGFSACNVGFRLSDQYIGQPGGLPIDAIYQPDTRHWLASSDSVYKTINPECIVPDYLISQDWQIAIYTLQLANCNQGKVIVEDYADARGGEILGLGPERGSPELGSYDKRPPWTKIDLTVQKCPYGEPLSDC